MRKVRHTIVLIYFITALFPLCGQTDTMHRHGFVNYREAADTLYARLLNKKYAGIQVFTVDQKTFLKETRKHDTIVPDQMVRGQYLSYWGKAERSYKKVYKKLRKRKVKPGRTMKDTVLIYRNTGAADVQRAELYISQKKYNAYIKYQLWWVDGLWYFTGKFELVEEKTVLK
jgi:hypothetical protein